MPVKTEITAMDIIPDKVEELISITALDDITVLNTQPEFILKSKDEQRRIVLEAIGLLEELLDQSDRV